MRSKEFARGTVQLVNLTDQTYTVMCEGKAIEGCDNAVGMFASLAGVKSTFRLNVGSQVLVWLKGPSIICCFAGDLPDARSHAGRSITGTGIKGIASATDPVDSETVPMHNAAQDLFDGELEIGFPYAGFIRFMTMMTSVGANTRAQIQFHLLRDLTRIISGNFEHFSAFGDDVIMDDGKVSQELNGTPHPHERLGLMAEGDPLNQQVGNFDGEKFDPLATGRWRYTKYLGFLGGMFNEWFTDPAETIGQMVDTAVRSGLSRIHHGPEGEVLIQSVTEVALERVVRILVPIRLKHPEDPTGVLREEFKSLDRQFLKTWPQKNGQTGHHALYALRDYSRWLAEYHSLARIHQLASSPKREFHVPSEEYTPPPEIGKHDPDVQQANAGNTYWKEAYATIRIGRDGSILLFDAYKNTYHSSPSGISIDTPKHFRVTAAGDISLMAGGSIFFKARRFVEIVAAFGGLLLRAKTGLKALVEKGTLLLASEFDPSSPYSPAAGDPDADVDANDYGVVISSTKAAAFVEGGKGVKVRQGSADHQLEISSAGHAKLDVTKTLEITALESMLLAARGDMFIAGSKVLCAAPLHFKNGTIISASRITTGTIGAKSVTAKGGFIGPAEKVTKVPALPDPALGYPDPDAEFVRREDLEDSTIKWKSLGDSEYAHPGNPEPYPSDAANMFEGLAQQYLRLESPDGYALWPADPVDEGTRVDSSRRHTFPGSVPKWMTCTPAQPSLDQASATAPSTMGTLEDVTLTSDPVSIKFLER